MKSAILILFMVVTACVSRPSLEEQAARCAEEFEAQRVQVACMQGLLQTEAVGAASAAGGHAIRTPPLRLHRPAGQAPLLGPVTPDAYGPGIWSDATGRPFEWRSTFDGQSVSPIFSDEVEPNAYGPGIGMDPFGRVVVPVEK